MFLDLNTMTKWSRYNPFSNWIKFPNLELRERAWPCSAIACFIWFGLCIYFCCFLVFSLSIVAIYCNGVYFRWTGMETERFPWRNISESLKTTEYRWLKRKQTGMNVAKNSYRFQGCAQEFLVGVVALEKLKNHPLAKPAQHFWVVFPIFKNNL